MSVAETDLGYVRSWFSTAFTKPWAWFGTASLVASLAAWALLENRPNLAVALSDLIWEIPLAIFGLTATARIFYAPVVIHRKAVARIKELQVQHNIQSQINELAKLRAKAITELYANSPKNDDELETWKQNHGKWRDEVLVVLRRNFSDAVVYDFSHLGEIRRKAFLHRYNGEHNHQLMLLARRLAILRRMINRHARLERV